MFEHSVKVPRHFKVVANIVKQVSTEGGSVKTLLYDNKLRHFKTNVLYALITETIKHAADIDKIFAHCQLFQTENRLDPWLAKVLTTELLFGKKTLPGLSKPEQTILSFKEQFEKYVSDHQDDLKNEVAPRPRYVRINTNLLTTSDAIRAFQDEGYHFIRCTSGSYEDYLGQIQKLTEYDFTQDYHIKTIFVFAPGTRWHDHELYLENKVILQDKATAMAVYLLAAPSGSVCLDMCAAPGMKTTQLAAYMRNKGKIYAVERDEKRYKTLCDFVEKTGSTCVSTLHRDSLEIRRGDHDDVEYILLDPSCSGSGMDFCVHNYIEETRLAKLTSLQEKFLKHAMNAFPKAKRIIYSTCSLYPEENERVITNVVKTSRAKWRVQDVKELLKGQWNNFGSGMYGSMGARCMYAKPDTDFTTGFFLAVLDRDEKDIAKAGRQEKNISETKKGDESKKRKKKSVLDRDEKDSAEAYQHKDKASDTRNDAGKSNDDDLKVADESGVDESNKRKKKSVLDRDEKDSAEAYQHKDKASDTRNDAGKSNDDDLKVADESGVDESNKRKKKSVLDRDETDSAEAYQHKDKASDTRNDAGKSNDDDLKVADESGVDESNKRKKKSVLDRDEKDSAEAYQHKDKASDTRNDAGKSNDDDLKVADESGVDESNKRKKNKVDGDESNKRKKNKVDGDESNKRKKNKVDGDESNKRKKNLNNAIEMEEITPKKKKKRDKTQEINLEAVMEESPKKKKDKRKLKDLLENLADLSVEESGAEVPRKKKKKDKQQYIDVETPIEISQDISNDISEGAEKKSKKKKSKVKDDEQMSEVVTEQKIKKKSKVAEVD